MISIAGLLTFVVLAFVAAYVQTITGFAFGLLLMGAVALAGLIPLLDAAIVISLLTLVNAIVVLAPGWRDITVKPFLLSLAGALPMVMVGYALLELLASTSLSVLRLNWGVSSSFPACNSSGGQRRSLRNRREGALPFSAHWAA